MNVWEDNGFTAHWTDGRGSFFGPPPAPSVHPVQQNSNASLLQRSNAVDRSFPVRPRGGGGRGRGREGISGNFSQQPQPHRNNDNAVVTGGSSALQVSNPRASNGGATIVKDQPPASTTPPSFASTIGGSSGPNSAVRKEMPNCG